VTGDTPKYRGTIRRVGGMAGNKWLISQTSMGQNKTGILVDSSVSDIGLGMAVKQVPD
jgi:hypothetical protein